jgi:hypothetical protein
MKMRNANLRPAVVRLLLLAALGVFAPHIRGQQVSTPCELKPPSASDFTDGKELPSGRWTLTYIVNAGQFQSGSSPVVVRGLLGISSVKQRAGKLRCATLENRTTRTVKTVRLRWDVRARDGGGEILAQGELPPIEVEIAAGAKLKAELRGANFADLLQPLVKDMTLRGDYLLTVGVAGVVFTDGAVEEVPDIR